ncbi:MAG: type II CAAX endopeptidase family protein [Chloroflexota bacterium]
MEENQVPAEKEAYTVPWSIGDTWLGVALLILLSIGMLVALFLGMNRQLLQNVGVLFLELIYLLPVALIFAWRRIHWRKLGFGKFSLNVVGIGCGLLLGGYIIILLHNAALALFGVNTQGDQIFEIFNQLQSPIWFFVVGAVVAPIVEEIFFRGFLFQGFRAKYGWLPAVLLSSAIFGAAHLDPVSLIPTFVLGCVLAYIYHRSNSVWPGILFHAAINSFSLCAVYVISQYPGLIPS